MGRPGQVRFEAWVPTDLYARFSDKVGNRKAWLVAAMSAEAGPPPGPHVHRRQRTGDRWVAGVNVGAWRCRDCDEQW